MDWFYSDGKTQLGPVDEAEFQRLVATGTITSGTLVWNQTMANWSPWGQVNPARAAVAAPPAAGAPSWDVAPGHETCTVCGRAFPQSDLLRYESALICGDCKPGYFQRMREGALQPGVMAYAGFWVRGAALFVDGIITNLLNRIALFALTAVMGDAQSLQGGGAGAFAQFFGAMMLVSLGLSLTYYVFFTGRFGATPGKMLLKLRIVRADGGSVSYMLALGRYFSYMLSGMILGIGYIMAAFDDEKRTLHDRICNTRVIRVQ